MAFRWASVWKAGVTAPRRTAGPERLAGLKPDPSGAHLLATTTDGGLVTDPAQDLPAQPVGDLDAAW